LVTHQRKHEWNRIFTPVVNGKTILLIGVGHIGGAAAEQAKALGLYVIGIRRSGKPHPHVDEMHGSDELHALLPRADIVMVTTALTSKTQHLIGAKEFALMKRRAAFINFSRGTVIDTSALRTALESGHLSDAMIDVTDPEPLPLDAALWDVPNLIITPRVINADPEQFVPRTLDIFFGNVRRHISGEPLTNVVDLKAEY
jgi:phosphoglycerate dehydrogenase-like enzyme